MHHGYFSPLLCPSSFCWMVIHDSKYTCLLPAFFIATSRDTTSTVLSNTVEEHSWKQSAMATSPFSIQWSVGVFMAMPDTILSFNVSLLIYLIPKFVNFIVPSVYLVVKLEIRVNWLLDLQIISSITFVNIELYKHSGKPGHPNHWGYQEMEWSDRKLLEMKFCLTTNNHSTDRLHHCMLCCLPYYVVPRE